MLSQIAGSLKAVRVTARTALVALAVAAAAGGVRAEPTISTAGARHFKVTFANIAPHNSHDTVGCGHWDMVGSVNGKPLELMRSTCVETGEGRFAFDAAEREFNGTLLRTLSPPLGPKSIEVTIPPDGFFVLEVNGRERDHTPDDAPSPYVKIIGEFYPKLDAYLEKKYHEQLSKAAKDIAIYREIATGLQTQFKGNDAAWAQAFQALGKTGETGVAVYAVFAAQSVPLWGQLAAAGYAVFNLVDFLADLNPDDGIGVLRVRCDSSNSFCLGTHDYRSGFNGEDDDSTGDYDLSIRVDGLGSERESVTREASRRSGTASGFLLQSGFGKNGNFELVVPRSEGGLAHFWRDNDAEGAPWRGPTVFGQELGHVDSAVLIESSLSAAGNGPGNLDVVARVGDRLVTFWRPDNGGEWRPAGAPQMAVSGDPAMIQGRFGKSGNFELVVPRSEGGLAHFWRDNDAEGAPWRGPTVFGQELGHVDSAVLLESSFSAAGNGPGNLEVLARVGDRLVAFWHPDNGGEWRPAGAPQMAVSGNLAFIQGRFGKNGNFELVVPRSEGGLAHFWRDNDAEGAPWRGPTIFGQELGHVDSVALIESSFTAAGNGPGNLEVVARVGDRLVAFWRPDNGGEWRPAGAPQWSR